MSSIDGCFCFGLSSIQIASELANKLDLATVALRLPRSIDFIILCNQIAIISEGLLCTFLRHSIPHLTIIKVIKMMPMNQKVSLGGKNNQQHINAYIEYCNLVGDHGGKLMDEREFEEYKKNYSSLAKNRVFNGWVNPKGLECKVVGPSTKCFCDHYYKNHDFLEAKDGKVKCKMQGCQCATFYYLPIYGSQDFKCSCKHSYQQHHVNKRNCKNCQCKDFTSTWSCPCGYKFSEHKNTVQKKQEREQRGAASHPINGGIVSYSSMLDGADRYENEVNQYLQDNPDKKVEVRDLKLKNPNEDFKGKMTAAVLYDTPLRFGK